MNIAPDYEIGHEEMRKINCPEIALAAPLSPCIGIAIYDPHSKSGYIAFDYGGNTRLIKATLDAAVNDFKDIKKLKVGVAGAGKTFHSGNKEWDASSDNQSDADWIELEALVNSYDFNKNNVKLFREKERGKYQVLYLDCNKGRIIAKSFDEKTLLPDEGENDYYYEDFD